MDILEDSIYRHEQLKGLAPFSSVLTVEFSPLVSHPREDFAAYTQHPTIAVVADGVSLDSYTNSDFPENSPASRIASHFSREILQAAKQGKHDSVVKLIEKGNHSIRASSHHLSLGCVAILAAVTDVRELSYAYVGDCRLRHYDSTGKIVFEVPDDLKATHDFLESRSFVSLRERNMFARNLLRNNLYADDGEGNSVGYGVLNGDPRAMAFCRSGKLLVSPGDMFLLFSDGAVPLLNNTWFERCCREYITTADTIVFESKLRDICRTLFMQGQLADDATLTFLSGYCSGE